MKERNESTLPLWAQEKIKRLENIIDREREILATKFKEIAGETKTPIGIRNYRVEGFVPIDSRVRFTMANGNDIELYFDEDQKVLKIYKVGLGRNDGSLRIKPVCSNVVEVS